MFSNSQKNSAKKQTNIYVAKVHLGQVDFSKVDSIMQQQTIKTATCLLENLPIWHNLIWQRDKTMSRKN